MQRIGLEVENEPDLAELIERQYAALDFIRSADGPANLELDNPTSGPAIRRARKFLKRYIVRSPTEALASASGHSTL